MASPLPALQTVAPEIVSLGDHERRAAEVLDAKAWAYFSGGAADERCLQANHNAWDALALWPRVLRPLAEGHTRTQLLGQEYAHPLLVAPMAFQRLAHADGELASAYAAAALGAGFTLSTQASLPLELPARAVLGTAGRGPLWFQLYLQHDRGFTRELLQRVESAGYEALVLTVDAPVSGVRDRERRAGFRLPAGISAVNLQGLASAPLPTDGALCAGLLRHAPTWDDLAWLQGETRLPVLLKGIMHPKDALQAACLQAAGIIVSNHGGRTLDSAPPTAVALARVAKALRSAGHTLPVLVDGGIRRGTDVLKAMALGASAVMVGRPIVWGLANAGAAGVAHVLRLLRDELEVAMALTGCATLADATPELLDT
ncbi:alpha-hydroxy acid oxidase [Comamonas endophytica]|uniref:Alpha-hydroxy-acid oxidizing protein n=1 Tax=Comamonas endophytica TaxID=2949090 RepID=A0ABY6GA96_9BURK|nr:MULTISPECIES: alpha-hydroxy acid oxidase [unclassified Acidovorax]MCD2512188.1 alpha-hydroxy-acid oxidizing protein [Acidovorax sp. D4N7]UYG51958.1 alpha-hydroxy-acid oxidizing protein [Acidovorax sp. 5MLIR]